MKKNQWGPVVWYTIHAIALGYPEKPTPEDKENYKRFYQALGHVLPCSKCCKNYRQHLNELPVDLFLSDRKALFKWTVALHNVVNKELGKPQYSEEFAESCMHSNPTRAQHVTVMSRMPDGMFEKNQSINSSRKYPAIEVSILICLAAFLALVMIQMLKR